jgi:hypothetical protein
MTAIEFSYAAIGVRCVYFRTYEGGLVMKRIRGGYLPPRSLYTDLPARFLFHAHGSRASFPVARPAGREG